MKDGLRPPFVMIGSRGDRSLILLKINHLSSRSLKAARTLPYILKKNGRFLKTLHFCLYLFDIQVITSNVGSLKSYTTYTKVKQLVLLI